ncbi:MAG: YfgM family protein [Gammaproteobacteria bacterium]
MDVYRTEEEQIEAMKRWWQHNAANAVIAVILGLGAIFGWRHWQNQGQEEIEKASRLYQRIIIHTREQDYESAEESATTMLSRYPDSIYAVFARLMLARLAVEEDDLDKAAQQLQTALGQNDNPTVEHLIRIRLARVLLTQEKTEDAASLLEVGETGNFAASYAELRGDVKSQQGDVAGARQAYEEAMQKAQEAGREDPAVEIKLNNLGK